MPPMQKTSFDIIKKQNGERFAKAVRNYDNGIFDIPGIADIVKYAGRDADPVLEYLSSLKKLEIKDTGRQLESPFELLHRAGYRAEYADTLKKQNSIKKYFKPGEELCTFHDSSRYHNYYILNAVRYDVDGIIRENFADPRREDDYGTSVISIQVLKSGGFISIKNRYNHHVNSPDNTFGSNPDNIIKGLAASIRRHFNVDFASREVELPNGYTFIKNRLIKYNTEVNNMYFGQDFFVADGVVREFDDNTQLVMDNFVFDLKNRWLVDMADTDDDFVYEFENLIKDKPVQVTKNKDGTKVVSVDGRDIVKLYDGRIIEVELPDTKTLNEKRRLLGNSWSVEKISLPALEQMPPYSNNYIPANPKWSMPLAWENYEKENPNGPPVMPPRTLRERAGDILAHDVRDFKKFAAGAKIAIRGIVDLQNGYGSGWMYFTPADEYEKNYEMKKAILESGVQKLKKRRVENVAASSRPVPERD
ncbi:MAG: hypothetical protein LBJ73_01415 [Rickettsiales bacterium]|jgi:hypothetical protein|nr:hypothetical protein [Rickettsiales bacterium]